MLAQLALTQLLVTQAEPHLFEGHGAVSQHGIRPAFSCYWFFLVGNRRREPVHQHGVRPALFCYGFFLVGVRRRELVQTAESNGLILPSVKRRWGPMRRTGVEFPPLARRRCGRRLCARIWQRSPAGRRVRPVRT